MTTLKLFIMGAVKKFGLYATKKTHLAMNTEDFYKAQIPILMAVAARNVETGN